MKDRSTMTRLEYWAGIVCKLIVAALWYEALLFRPLALRTTQQSRVILVMLLLASVYLCGLVFSRWRTGWVSTASLALPFGAYTVLAYRATFPLPVLAALLAGGLLSLGYCLLLLTGKMQSAARELRCRLLQIRFYRCAYGTACIFTVVFLVLMAGLGGHSLLRGTLLPASVPAQAKAQEPAEERPLWSHVDTVLKLRPEVWEGQTTKERLNILQTVCNIEAAYLGLPTAVMVEGGILVYPTVGSYTDEPPLIRIDLNYLENDPVEEVLATLLHEVYHAYEHRLADLYQAAPPQAQRLRLFETAACYAREIDEYITARQDLLAYKMQALELDSDRYAEAAAEQYYALIDVWLEENAEAPDP